MYYIQNLSPRKITFYGESINDLEKMPTTNNIGQEPYPKALAPEGTLAEILTEDGLDTYMLRSNGWVKLKNKNSGGGGSGGTGTDDYNDLRNKPQINGVTLKGNKSFEDLGLIAITQSELRAMWN